MNLIIKKNLKVEYEARDEAHPYRVVNINNLKKRYKNEPEIIYFCKTREMAIDVINNLEKYIGRN